MSSVLQGEFSLEGRFPEVRENVKLVQGLFNESLPHFINSHYKNRHPVDITYLHIDCDLYAGKAIWFAGKNCASKCVGLLLSICSAENASMFCQQCLSSCNRCLMVVPVTMLCHLRHSAVQYNR